MEPVKKSYLSKTLWINLVLTALGLFLPSANAWCVAHPSEVLMIVSGLNMGLRLISKDKVELW